MYRKLAKRVKSICRAYFRRNFAYRKSVERVELSCHSDSSWVGGILRPKEWIDIAHGARVRAIAITDFQDVQGFKEAAQAVEGLRREAGPGALDFKVLYGLETMLEDGCLVHLLVQRQEGLAQLYRLLEIAWQGREKRPFLRKAEISEHRTGLLVGCPGENGELERGILKHLNDARLEEIAGFYDYLSVLPPQHYKLPSSREHTREAPGTEDLLLKTIAIGKRSGKLVAAVGNMRIASQDWGMFRTSFAYGIQKEEDRDLGASLPDILYTEEMLDAFSFLEKKMAKEIVIHAPNRLADLCEDIRIFPEDERCFQPILPNAFRTLADLCRERLRIRYSGEIPDEVREWLEREFTILQNDELLCSVLLVSSRLVHGLQGKGYPVSVRAHSAAFVHAHSYAAYLLGITEVEPLALHVPSGALRGLDTPDLEFSLHVPEEYLEDCWKEAIEIFAQIFPQGMAVSYGDSVGWARKASLSHRRILVPDAAELRNWIPLRKVYGGYLIPYGRPDEFPHMFRLSLWPVEHFPNLYCIQHRVERLGTTVTGRPV